MGYISTDEKAGIKDRPQQRPNVQEDQHNFEDENGKIEERRSVRVLLKRMKIMKETTVRPQQAVPV